MARHKEPLSGGLWTAADPGVLEPGQLSDARNCLYLAGSQALQRSSGRDVFGVVSATATAVVGLRDAQFDNGDHYLIALAGDTLRTAPVGDTGSFTTLGTLAATASQLEVAHFRNRFYLFSGAVATASGAASNRVFYLSATAVSSTPQSRVHGLLPVEASPNVTTAAGGFSQSVTGYYEYWTTEVAKLSADSVEFSMESSFQGKPTTVFVSTTATLPTIQRPDIVNSIATHWRIYRSPKKDSATDVKFPSGFMIAEISTATAQQADASATSDTGFIFPASFNTGAEQWDDFANASNMGADDGNVATIAVTQSLIRSHGCYNFNFGGFRGAVKGIEVELQGFVSTGSAPATVSVRIGRNRQSNGTYTPDTSVPLPDYAVGAALARNSAVKSGLITSTSAGAPTTLTLGSSTDRWMADDKPPFVDTDFGTSFMAVVNVVGTGSQTLSFDYVRVKVYYAATVDSVIPFPTVVYNFGDITSQVGKNGPPPSSSTGDLYEDSLVVNDVNAPALVRYSYPGDPEAFPATYYIDFETRENDRVRAIKVVNDQLMVWLDSSTWRINYLPSERDASFDRGKAKKPVSSTYGCVDPMCMTVFSPGGDVDLAAFVSHHGIHATDGYSFETYTEGLDWSNITGDGAGTPICLINDRARSLLLYFFRNDNDYGSETYMCLAMSYGEGHWNGKPKMCGLWHMRNHSGGNFASLESAWPVQRSNGVVSVYLGYGGSNTDAGAGKVYRETGTAIPALDPRVQFVTREMYLADHGNEWSMGELYGYAHGYGTSTPTVSYTLQTRKTNDTALTTRGTKSLTLSGQKMHRAGFFHDNCEAAKVTMVATASAFAEEFLVIDGTEFGQEDSGR